MYDFDKHSNTAVSPPYSLDCLNSSTQHPSAIEFIKHDSFIPK